MIVLVNKYLLGKGFDGVALWPFVIVRHPALAKDAVFLNHEKIHLRQQLELLIIPFYLWYSLEFLVRFLQYGKTHKAYKNISFEREAYKNEKDLQYCRNRKFWNFFNYLFY